MKQSPYLWRNRGGQALVEMALVLPILLLILLGTWQTADLLHKHLLLTGASREGARLAAVGATDEAIRERVKAAGATLTLEDGDITITPEEPARRPGEPVTVRVRAEVGLIAPVFFGLLPDPFPLTAETTMRVE